MCDSKYQTSGFMPYFFWTLLSRYSPNPHMTLQTYPIISNQLITIKAITLFQINELTNINLIIEEILWLFAVLSSDFLSSRNFYDLKGFQLLKHKQEKKSKFYTIIIIKHSVKNYHANNLVQMD